MNYNIEEHSNCIVIAFRGNVMGGPEVGQLNEQLHEFIDDEKTNIVADLGQVKLMNSSGLGMLIGGMTTMRKAGGDLRLANVTDKVERLLSITKLDTVFKYYESTEEAIDSYSE